jgi:hypothetical protein
MFEVLRAWWNSSPRSGNDLRKLNSDSRAARGEQSNVAVCIKSIEPPDPPLPHQSMRVAAGQGDNQTYMYEITKEELSRYKADSSRSLQRQRLHGIHYLPRMTPIATERHPGMSRIAAPSRCEGRMDKQAAIRS